MPLQFRQVVERIDSVEFAGVSTRMEAAIRTASLVYQLFGDMKLALSIVNGTQIPVPDPHKFSFTTGEFWQFQMLHDFRRLQRLTGSTQPAFDYSLTSGVRVVGQFGMWGRLATCARVGNPRKLAPIANRRAGYHPAPQASLAPG
jgi:hypothetical protein